jgi:hypothetical protein
MTQLDYKKTFSKLSHIKALSHDQKFEAIVQNLITHALNQNSGINPKNENQIAARINEIYGISIRSHIVISNLDKLLNQNKVVKDPVTKQYHVTQLVSNQINKRLKEADELENSVKVSWFNEIITFLPEITQNELDKLWCCLKSYLCNIFEQHGIQTLQFLNPSTKITDEDQRNLIGIVENILKENDNPFTIEIFSSSINQFIHNADEIRTNYISQLADATFTSFALTSDAETVKFLNKRYNNLELFLDTNFIFGILDLHKNKEDASAIEILEEVGKNRLPFRLVYHPETLAEFKRAFDARALYVRAAKWTRESSRVALAVDGLSPIEELFHRQNIDNEIDPSVFLEKYNHVDYILKDLGLNEYIPNDLTNDELVEIETDVELYQKFYETVPNRKNKSFLGFKHDIVVLKEVRGLNPKKTKFLESNAFFISSDFILAKFERNHYKRNWEINYVVNPSVFLQLIRPFIENDYNSNKRFIDTFSIPEFRAFDIDYTTTRSKTLQILNDNYHSTSFETKVKILRDQVLMEKLDKVSSSIEKQNAIIENQIAIENQILTEQNAEAFANISQIEKEKEKVELEKNEVEKEKNIAKTEIETINKELKIKAEEIVDLKTTHAIQSIEQQIEYKKGLLDVLDKSISNAEKRHLPILKIIDNKVKNHIFFLSIIALLFFLIIVFLIYKLTWSVMEPYTYVFSIFAGLFSYFYFAIKGESLDPSKYFEHFKKDIASRVYSEFDFDNSDLDLQKNKKADLKKEIIKLTEEIKNRTPSA